MATVPSPRKDHSMDAIEMRLSGSQSLHDELAHYPSRPEDALPGSEVGQINEDLEQLNQIAAEKGQRAHRWQRRVEAAQQRIDAATLDDDDMGEVAAALAIVHLKERGKLDWAEREQGKAQNNVVVTQQNRSQLWPDVERHRAAVLRGDMPNNNVAAHLRDLERLVGRNA